MTDGWTEAIVISPMLKKSAGIITHNMNESSEKNNFFLRLGFFIKLGKKSPKFHWEMVENSALENTKKSPDACLAGR